MAQQRGVGATDSHRPALVEDRVYAYKTYTETLRFFEELEAQYPDIVETWVAQKEFPQMLLSSKKNWGTCEGQTCQTLVVRIANKEKLTDTTPEVFFSGALHGNERVGPLAVTELAKFLCEQYTAGHEEVRRLVDGRGTWIMPMTNAHGYANNKREELGMDPNRDFSYMQDPAKCMMTQTGRAVNELFRRHLFHFMITFHGGMRALTYEWGSPNHIGHGKSTESPDDRAFADVGRQLQGDAGRSSGKAFYPLGRISDLVYPVNGGMEDWSYGAGWEESPDPITVCRPSTYGGYDEARTRYKQGSIATLVYLAEMDDEKTPPASTLGRAAQVWDNGDAAGHVPRNMRMCLRAIELARPEVVVHPPSWADPVSPLSDLELRVHGFGCLELTSARLLLVPRALVKDCTSLTGPQGSWNGTARDDVLAASLEVARLPRETACRGLTIWNSSVDRGIVTLRGAVPRSASGDFCAAVAAEFDQGWGRQSHPDPATGPRALASRARLEERFAVEASEGPMRIDEHRTKLFPVRDAPLHVEAGEVAATQSALFMARGVAPSRAPQRASMRNFQGAMLLDSGYCTAWILVSVGLIAAITRVRNPMQLCWSAQARGCCLPSNAD